MTRYASNMFAVQQKISISCLFCVCLFFFQPDFFVSVVVFFVFLFQELSFHFMLLLVSFNFVSSSTFVRPFVCFSSLIVVVWIRLLLLLFFCCLIWGGATVRQSTNLRSARKYQNNYNYNYNFIFSLYFNNCTFETLAGDLIEVYFCKFHFWVHSLEWWRRRETIYIQLNASTVRHHFVECDQSGINFFFSFDMCISEKYLFEKSVPYLICKFRNALALPKNFVSKRTHTFWPDKIQIVLFFSLSQWAHDTQIALICLFFRLNSSNFSFGSLLLLLLLLLIHCVSKSVSTHVCLPICVLGPIQKIFN